MAQGVVEEKEDGDKLTSLHWGWTIGQLSSTPSLSNQPGGLICGGTNEFIF